MEEGEGGGGGRLGQAAAERRTPAAGAGLGPCHLALCTLCSQCCRAAPWHCWCQCWVSGRYSWLLVCGCAGSGTGHGSDAKPRAAAPLKRGRAESQREARRRAFAGEGGCSGVAAEAPAAAAAATARLGPSPGLPAADAASPAPSPGLELLRLARDAAAALPAEPPRTTTAPRLRERDTVRIPRGNAACTTASMVDEQSEMRLVSPCASCAGRLATNC